ncbi:GNAT family N-acetyltransferase [Clostridium estertheticum]|uniref:GNAT family N-acetyltransferase n=1 Tax=Clostridium estertheticum TaxID=238834 RepID=UPI001CF352B5|nr:GNAT family N-acetyltransferase [Clostridium estertheticum]MCB2354217.1 GNAT family N-acetyltransferase [Clostridium estertheticum]WAG42660.1 GNAT family N-acetyltransferase [Clostridium estertheticum]
MKLVKANLADFNTVKNIINTTIKTIYPHYYPAGVVEFFLTHHCDDNIRNGIETEMVLLIDVNGIIVGTGSAHENEISRVFVLPQLQGLGYGTLIMNRLESIIAKGYSEIVLDSSLPAYNLYINRGYSPIKYNKIITTNKDILCFNIMKKAVVRCIDGKINYNNRLFSSVSNTHNGEVLSATIFQYHQNKDMVWAEYNGGDILKGYLIGTSDDKSNLNFTYQHINQKGEIRTGKCLSTPKILTYGRISLLERWQWTNGDNSFGHSIIEESNIIKLT